MFYLLAREVDELISRIEKLEGETHPPQDFLHRYNKIMERLDKTDKELKELWEHIHTRYDG